MLLSIVVPCYKREKIIKSDIENLLRALKSTRYQFEIILVVDGFLDKAYKKAKEIKDSRVRVYGYKDNKGKGFAVRYGMSKAKGDIVGYIDAGMDIDVSGISMLLEHMIWYEADVMVASKRHPASTVSNYRFYRRIYSFGYQVICRILSGLKIRDTQVGLKVYKKEVLKKILPRLLVKKFAFEIEMLAVAKRLGFKRIFEGPMKIIWSSKEENSSFSAGLLLDPFVRNMLIDTLAVFYRLKVIKFYDDNKDRIWKFDKDSRLRVLTGDIKPNNFRERLIRLLTLNLQ